MSQGTIIFTYNGKQVVIPCTTNEKLSLICERFITKLQLDRTKNYYYIYGGNIINKELSLEEQSNNEDKREKRMNILVYDEMKRIINDNIKESKEVICPECKENILIKIEDYRISLYNCKNNHKIENISIKEFDNLQKIDESKIICEICKINNKNKTYKNEMNYCLACKKIICPLCKSKHNNNHLIIKYEDRNIVCNKHNDKYVKYCNECNENLCMQCIKEHKNHKGIFYGDIIDNIDNNNEYKEYIDKLINNIDEIVNKLEEVKENMNIYYNKSNNIINNNNINYEILQNIKEFNNYNNKIKEDIKGIINENNINNKFNNIMKIYEKINYKFFTDINLSNFNTKIENDLNNNNKSNNYNQSNDNSNSDYLDDFIDEDNYNNNEGNKKKKVENNNPGNMNVGNQPIKLEPFEDDSKDKESFDFDGFEEEEI